MIMINMKQKDVAIEIFNSMITKQTKIVFVVKHDYTKKPVYRFKVYYFNDLFLACLSCVEMKVEVRSV